MAVWKLASTTMAAMSFCSLTVTWFLIQYIGESKVMWKTEEEYVKVLNAERELGDSVQLSSNKALSNETDVTSRPEWYPVEVVKWQVFVQSAIINHHRSNSTHTAVIITAWNYHKHENPFFCCFRQNDGNVTAISATFMFRHRQGLLSAHQFGCFVSKKISFENKVFFSVNNCVDHVTRSVPIVYPERMAGKMAVCTTLYNIVDAEHLVEWFELQKLQGVHKIQVFDFQLGKEQKQVLEYYQQQDFLLLQTLILPVGLAAPPRRGFLLSDRPYENQFQADEQIPIFDCTGRLSGYDYVGVYDVHEVVVPQQPNISLPTFFQKLGTSEPKAGVFFFKTEEFLKEWGVSRPSSVLSMMSYVYRKTPSRMNEKMVHVPGNILWQDMHHVQLVEPYYASFLESTVAALHYYGECRYTKKSQCKKSHRVEDRQLLRYEDDLKIRVNRAKQHIQILFNNTNLFNNKL